MEFINLLCSRIYNHGTMTFTEEYVKDEVRLTKEITELAEVAASQPHAAYTAYTHGLSSRGTHQNNSDIEDLGKWGTSTSHPSSNRTTIMLIFMKQNRLRQSEQAIASTPNSHLMPNDALILREKSHGYHSKSMDSSYTKANSDESKQHM